MQCTAEGELTYLDKMNMQVTHTGAQCKKCIADDKPTYISFFRTGYYTNGLWNVSAHPTARALWCQGHAHMKQHHGDLVNELLEQHHNEQAAKARRVEASLTALNTKFISWMSRLDSEKLRALLYSRRINLNEMQNPDYQAVHGALPGFHGQSITETVKHFDQIIMQLILESIRGRGGRLHFLVSHEGFVFMWKQITLGPNTTCSDHFRHCTQKDAACGKCAWDTQQKSVIIAIIEHAMLDLEKEHGAHLLANSTDT
eukprot:gene122-7008_t